MKHLKTISKYVTVPILTFGLSIAAVNGANAESISSTPQSSSTVQSDHRNLTVDQFENQLKTAATSTRDANENYVKFTRLSTKDKNKLVSYLNDPAVMSDLLDQFINVQGSDDPQQTRTLLGGDAVVSKSSTEIQSAASTKNPSGRAVAAAADPTVARTSQYSYSILGILMTRVRLDANFSYNSTRITNVLSCTASYTNYYPLRGMSATTDRFLSGNNGVCQATWQIAIGWVNGVNLGQRAALQKMVMGPWGMVSDTFVNI
ncbi:hypothetical protein [Specibacter cremeus]|uniref:hypothetical protein n=1 Tax=Specibacter cremeus TaxID=1629051 RepID=UPI000F791E63|nr:hypothetical protein [Specibacter cremeus]